MQQSDCLDRWRFGSVAPNAAGATPSAAMWILFACCRSPAWFVGAPSTISPKPVSVRFFPFLFYCTSLALGADQAPTSSWDLAGGIQPVRPLTKRPLKGSSRQLPVISNGCAFCFHLLLSRWSPWMGLSRPALEIPGRSMKHLTNGVGRAGNFRPPGITGFRGRGDFLHRPYTVLAVPALGLCRSAPLKMLFFALPLHHHCLSPS